MTVKKAVKSLNLHPVMFEEGARPYPPRAVYRSYVEQSHIYVGIFSESYGWVAPDMDISGIEDEFNLSSHIRRLVYIKQTTHARDPRLEELLKRIEKEQKVCYRRFSNADDLAELVKDDIIQLLSESFQLAIHPLTNGAPPPPSYLDDLRRNMQISGVIERKELNAKLRQELARNPFLVVTGEPGIGKTYTLGAVGGDLNAVYISLRNKTTQYAFSHLANHLSVRGNRTPENLPSEADARTALQEELANSAATLIIDDADQNQTVLRALLNLDRYNCRLVIVARDATAQIYEGIPSFHVDGFSRDEIDRFLSLHSVSLSSGEVAQLVSTSRGNPLYLYYFVQRRLSPFPAGLAEYQTALWRSLTPLQQQAMSFVAYSHIPPNALHLHELMETQKSACLVSETEQILGSLGPLLRLVNKHFEVFHPYFAEHIRSVSDSDGSSTLYHRVLGEFSAAKTWPAAAAFHFISCGDPRSRRYLVSGAEDAILQGDWPLAEDLLGRALTSIQTKGGGKHREAYVRSLLAQIYVEVGRREDARNESDESVRLFREAGDSEWAQNIEIWSATLLIDEGKACEAVAILERAVGSYKGKDSPQEAVAHLNLSLTYLKVSRFQEGARAAEHALKLFTELEDEGGIRASLINLGACIGALGHLDLQEKYAKKILEEASKRQLWRLKCAGLNHLASVQRQRKDPAAAQASIEECIAIARRFGSVEIEALNSANLGNALRDQKKYELAEKAYVESLTLARQHKLRRLEGHALELIGTLRCGTGLFAEAVQFGRDALAIHIETGEPLRIASTYEDLGEAYEKLGQIREAATCKESSGDHYKTANLWKYAGYRYGEASLLFCSIDETQHALECASQSIKCMASAADSDAGRRLVASLADSQPRAHFGKYYIGLLSMVLRDSSFPLVHLVESLIAHCKRASDAAEKAYAVHGINLLIQGAVNSADARLLNALALGFEQADETICSAKELDTFEERVCESLQHLYFRSLPDKSRVWIVGLPWKNPIVAEILVPDEVSIARRMAIALALILLGNKDALEAAISTHGGNQEIGFSLMIATQTGVKKEFELDLPKRDHADEFPADFTASNVPWGQPQPPTMLILRDNYGDEADCARKPGNKAFLGIILNLLGIMVSHCVHQRGDVPSIRKEIVSISETILTFRSASKPSAEDS
jgi:tetratricopeptide (TPR) repeat protein